MSMTTTTYTVKGMTCGHCVAAVSGEITKLPAVTNVDIELETGAVTVTSNDSLDIDAVRAAVDEAGYELVA